ncbi:MAG: sodium/proline symporter [bacterium]|nr:sodium/proline symporter [Gammaproteobacteria bacterium]HIL96792.1 sodium/proline symporter [Pseudomonadales bacterium]
MMFLYFGVLIAIGYIASRRIHGIRDFFVGGKSLGYWVAAFSTQATGESAWLLLGLTGMGAVAGVSAYWVVVGELVGVSVAWFLMAKRFKALTDHYDSLTVTDFLVSRFRQKSHLLRLVATVSLTAFVLAYISAQIDATGSAFERFLGWDYHLGAVIGFVVVVIYCVLGGFLAVAWTDLFQGVVMLVCLVALPLVAWYSLDPSVGLFEKLASIDPALVSITGSTQVSLMSVLTIVGMMLIGLGFMGSPQIFVRFIAIKSEQEIQKGRWVAVAFTLLVDTSAVSIGLIGRYLFTDTGTDPTSVLGNGAQNVLPELVEHVFPSILVGLYIAAVLAAIMSTVSSLLIMAAGAVTHDFYQVIVNPALADHQAARFSRWVTVSLAVIALGVALTVSVLSPDRTIFWFVIFGWSGIAATFCPMMILSLFWKQYTASGAISSMLVGFLAIPLFKFVVQNFESVGPHFTALEALPPAFALSLTAGFLVSLLSRNQAQQDAYLSDLATTDPNFTDSRVFGPNDENSQHHIPGA